MTAGEQCVRIQLAADRRHYLRAEEARVEGPWLVAVVNGERRCYSAAEVASVRWPREQVPA